MSSCRGGWRAAGRSAARRTRCWPRSASPGTSELSGGQQQRVAIARALATRPQVVFADEPTGALDSAASRVVLALLRGLVDDHGLTVVMVTHDPRAAGYADRALFLADGRIRGELADPAAESVAARLAALEAGS